MANSNLTSTQVTREALRVLHQKLNFIGTVNREYDNRFANSGAKIGDTLTIRQPNEYTVRTGQAINTQDVTEGSTTLQVATQKGVDLSFTSKDLTMDIDDFSSRYINPAMSVLAASIEADALSMVKDVYNLVDNDGAALSLANILSGRQNLNDNLAPMDASRTAMLSTAHSATLVNALSGLFQDSEAIKKQYKEGMMGRTAGFDFYENTLVSDHTTGTGAEGDTTYNVNGIGQTGASLVVDGGTSTFLKGDVITIAGCNRVHPETKTDTGSLQQFVVTADSGASATSIAISPSIVISGAKQNVSAAPTNDGAVNKIGAGAGELLNSSMVYHKDAFTFATADLIMPSGLDFASRENFDGISLRIVRQYDINNDSMPCRIDVLYGYKAIRPQLACRIHADG